MYWKNFNYLLLTHFTGLWCSVPSIRTADVFLVDQNVHCSFHHSHLSLAFLCYLLSSYLSRAKIIGSKRTTKSFSLITFKTASNLKSVLYVTESCEVVLNILEHDKWADNFLQHYIINVSIWKEDKAIHDKCIYMQGRYRIMW